MSTANRVIKNTGWLYAKMAITMFVSLYTTRLILNGLGASDFGIFNIVGGAISMLGFLNAAMASATQRFMSFSEGAGNHEKKTVIFNVSIVLHFIIAVIVGLLLALVSMLLFNGILNIPAERIFAAKVVYGSLIISTMFTVMSVPYDALINSHENMRYYAIVGLLESFLKLAVAFICVYTALDKLIVYGILMACIPLFTLSILRIYCHRNYLECKLSPCKYFDRRTMREMTGFAIWNFLSSISSMVSQYGIGIVLNHFFGTIINAAQGITNQLSGQLGALSANAMKSLNPTIVKSAGAQNYAKMQEVSLVGSKIIFLITTICFLPVLANLNTILQFWLINIPPYTVIFMQLYFTVNIIDNIAIGLSTAINGMGKIKKLAMTNSVISLSTILISFLLFLWGFKAEAYYIILVFASFLKLVTRVYISITLCKFKWHGIVVDNILRSVLPFIISLLISILLSKYVDNTPIMVLLALIIVEIIIYSSVFYLIGFTKEEKHHFSILLESIILKIKSHR